jgi:hypothetical protein
MTLVRARKRNGRSKYHGRFIAVPYYLVQTHAWSRLTPIARATWLEIAALYTGNNNGRLAVSTRWLAGRLNVSLTSAWRAVGELVTFGFLECTQASSFSQKRLAAEYRLTHLACDRTGALASRAYESLPNGLEREPHSFTRETVLPQRMHPP